MSCPSLNLSDCFVGFVVEHWRRSYLWSSFKDSRSHIRWPDCLWWCKHHRTVNVGTCCFVNDPFLDSRLLTRLNDSFSMQIKCLCSYQLAIVGCWDLARNSIWPSYSHRFHILQTVKGSRPTRAATLQCNKPISR